MRRPAAAAHRRRVRGIPRAHRSALQDGPGGTRHRRGCQGESGTPGTAARRAHTADSGRQPAEADSESKPEAGQSFKDPDGSVQGIRSGLQDQEALLGKGRCRACRTGHQRMDQPQRPDLFPHARPHGRLRATVRCVADLARHGRHRALPHEEVPASRLFPRDAGGQAGRSI